MKAGDDTPPESATAAAVHTPILLDEVIDLLGVRAGGRYVDATANGGGHTRAILAASAPDGRILAIDRDADLVARLAETLRNEVSDGRLVVLHANFADLGDVARTTGFDRADGILFDLGLSSYHLDRSGRGFAFAHDEPLDMRFCVGDESRPARALLARASAAELQRIFRELGEERFASRIARSIVSTRDRRPIETTADLLAVIEQSLPASTRWRAGRHAARIFQALRIAVNDELAAVAAALPQAWDCLAPRGRLIAMSFHSLEDRIVKRYFRELSQSGRGKLLVKRPIIAGAAEIARNSRAASAKLRAIEKN